MNDLRIGPYPLDRVRFWSLIAAGVWAVCCIVAWIFQPALFYRAYLVAWVFWLGVSLGAMGVVMLHHLTGGAWGVGIRRLGEHAAMTLPLMAVLFIPIAIGMRWLYPWDRPEAMADPISRHAHPYLNSGGFIVRAIFCFIVWIAMAWYLRSASLRQDSNWDPRTARRMHNLSAGGMVVYVFVMSMASVDWIMSREPHWYSTAFGLIICCAQSISGLAFLIVALLLLRETAYRETANPDQLNDLGNLLLTVVILWTYTAFAQFLVQWMGNKQDEIPWYVKRLSNGWGWIGAAILAFHFFVPFLTLLMRQAKRRFAIMLWLCATLLVFRCVDVFWNIAPSGTQTRPLLHHVVGWTDFVFPIGMGGIWIATFLWLMNGHPMISAGQPLPAVEPHAA